MKIHLAQNAMMAMTVMLILQCVLIMTMAILFFLADELDKKFKERHTPEEIKEIRLIQIMTFFGALIVLICVACPWIFLAF